MATLAAAAAPSGAGRPNELLRRWQSLSGLPGGRWLFSLLLGRMARYTGSIGARVEELSPGRCRVAMADRPAVRNHLRSIHAIALANLAEVSSGLAMLSGLPEEARGILTGLEVEYLKKARGRLLAECVTEPPTAVSERREVVVEAVIRDAAGDVVARGRARWLVGPR